MQKSSDEESSSSDLEHETSYKQRKTEIKDDESERKRIREEISNMSFEDLQKLKEKMGTKLYNQKYHGVAKKKAPGSLKRVNKNRPREVSSKVRPRFVLPAAPTLIKKKPMSRDPRFDNLCGTFDKKEFNDNYKFVNDIKKDERKKLQKECDETEDPQEKQKIKLLMQRIDNQLRENEKHQNEQKKKAEERSEIRQQLKSGQKPVYKKKSEKRIESLVEKYETLKKSNKLQKHIEKRSKKLAVKDRKQIERTYNE